MLKKIKDVHFLKRKTLSLFIEKILNNEGKVPKMFVQYYCHQKKPNNILVLKNVRKSDLVTGYRVKGLDINCCALVVKSLANIKLHRLSL